MSDNPYQVYKTQSLQTLTNGEIVVKLFAEAVKQIKFSTILLDRGQSVPAFDAVVKAQKIVSALRSSLDMSYAISLNLSDLYLFINDELYKAIKEKDTKTLNRLAGMLEELHSAFKEADKIARSQKSVG